RYQLGEGYTGWLAEHGTPLLITDTSSYPDLEPKGGLRNFPFKSYLGAPLLWEEDLLGTIEIAHRTSAYYSVTERDRLVAVATQLALILRFYRLQHQTDQHARQQALSNDIYQLAAQVGELNHFWESLSRTYLAHLDLSLLGIFVQRDGSTELTTPYLFRKLTKGWEHAPASLSAPTGSGLAAIWHHQEYCLSNQVNTRVLSELGLDAIVKRQSLDKMLITPLFAGSERIGLMVLGRSKQLPIFHEEEGKTLVSLGRQTGSLLHNRQQLQPTVSFMPAETDRGPGFDLQEAEAAISPERMAELLRLSAELTASLDIDRSLKRVLSLCNQLMLADRAVLMTRDLTAGDLSLRQVMPENEPVPGQQADALFATSQSICEWMITRRKALLLDDLGQDGRWQLENFNSLCAVPCISGDEITGILLFFAKPKAAFGSDEQQIAQVVARQVANALNNTYLYSVIRDQADRLGLMLRSRQIEFSQSNAILESIADGVIVTDADHRVILFNAAAERILNLSTTQVIGREVFDFIGIFGSETIQWGETIRQWHETPPDRHIAASKPERMVLEDGRVISILPAPVVLGNDFLGTVSIFRDITREVEVDRLKSEFVATVSHELRSPMTSIKGFVDVMLMGAAGDLNDKQRHFLEIVRTNTTRLEILVNDLLDISRIEAGKATLVFQEIDVHQLLLELKQYVQHRSQEESKAMHVNCESPKVLPPIWGDLERVRQILANIVENSFDYTPEGGSIQISARRVDDQIEVDVIDNGMG
ncbi:MAG: GAF domain-containing protein, partial [Anaerolineales bacterium]|nr:GAF domain-containing protein [Anaerolineales bacterium]